MEVSRLISPFSVNIWGTVEQLQEWMVEACLLNGESLDRPLGPEDNHTDVMLHAKRVAYFYNNPDDTPIHLFDRGDYYWVADGNHRLASLIMKGVQEIASIFIQDII